MEIFRFTAGSAPMLMSIPHVGTHIPEPLAGRMTAAALGVPDTDWDLDRLYDFAGALGIGVLQATQSRYVVDLNRPPDGWPLYHGASNTELVPTTTFAEQPIYLPGCEPVSVEMEDRVATYWQPFHDRLLSELSALRDRHGAAVLFDCHSIRSRVPRFFDGTLPDFNLGTGDGASCAARLRVRLADELRADARYSLAVDGRFKGGYITRHYGQPAEGLHAFQMELSIATYMDERADCTFREDLADKMRPTLRRMLEAALEWVA